MNKSIILNTDSYKTSQWVQYPDGTTRVFSYIESRGGMWDSCVMFGLQHFLMEYLSEPVKSSDVAQAERLFKAHGIPFNREGWMHIVENHEGRLPLVIKAVPEGSVVPVGNVLVTVENTDPECFWLTSYVETALLRAVWYGSTVATNSFESKKIIMEYLEKSGDPSLIDFKLHDFGARGVSSFESCGIGSVAHLVNFKGSDSITGLLFADQYYGDSCAAFSIPAMEHSTVTSWGREGEVASYCNMLNHYAKDGAILAAVSDSYDIYKACEYWGTVLKDQIVNSGATLVVRPDSGTPHIVVDKCLKILDKYFGHTINDKGYKVLNNVRIIQGDGIDHAEINSILFQAVDLSRYSADNITFGQGGGLLQAVDRDTLKWAMKCSAIKVNGEWRDVYKDPVTDSGKRSKRGRITLVEDFEGNIETVREGDVSSTDKILLEEVWKNGELVRKQTFQDIRERANKPFQK